MLGLRCIENFPHLGRNHYCLELAGRTVRWFQLAVEYSEYEDKNGS